MILQIPFKPKIILALLVAVVLMVVSSFFFFEKMESIVHGDLYYYGLIFSYEWVNSYWANSHMYMYSLELATILFGISIVFFLFHMRNRKDTLSSYICSLLLVVGAGMSFFSIYIFFRLNYIVNHDLYSYGLIFSDKWFADFSLYTEIMVSLIAFAAVLALATSTVVYLSGKKTVRVVLAKLIDSTMIAIGTVALAFSIVYASDLLTLIGLGLLFWGVTFSYVRTEEYTKKVLLQTTASAQLVKLNQVIQELEFTGYPIYLPPKYFRKRDIYKAYIPKDRLALIPTPEQMNREEPKFFIEFIESPPAVLMTPPGAELVQLFEKMLKKDFSKVNLVYLQRNLPKLLIEDLEIAQYFEIAIESDKVRVVIDNSVYNFPNLEPEQANIFPSFGSPLSSAIACILAKVSGNPVMRVNPRTGVEGRRATIEYRILRLGEKTS